MANSSPDASLNYVAHIECEALTLPTRVIDSPDGMGIEAAVETVRNMTPVEFERLVGSVAAVASTTGV